MASASALQPTIGVATLAASAITGKDNAKIATNRGLFIRRVPFAELARLPLADELHGRHTFAIRELLPHCARYRRLPRGLRID